MPVYVYILDAFPMQEGLKQKIALSHITSQHCFSIHYAILWPRFEFVTSITQNKELNGLWRRSISYKNQNSVSDQIFTLLKNVNSLRQGKHSEFSFSESVKHRRSFSCLLLQYFHSIPCILLEGILCFTTHPPWDCIDFIPIFIPFSFSISCNSIQFLNVSTAHQITPLRNCGPVVMAENEGTNKTKRAEFIS